MTFYKKVVANDMQSAMTCQVAPIRIFSLLNPTANPAERIAVGKEERRNEREMTFALKKKTSSRTICSPRRRVKWLQSEYFRFSTKSQPNEAVVIWKGGARERADDVLLFHRNKRTWSQSELCDHVARKEGFEPSRRF